MRILVAAYRVIGELTGGRKDIDDATPDSVLFDLLKKEIKNTNAPRVSGKAYCPDILWGSGLSEAGVRAGGDSSPTSWVYKRTLTSACSESSPQRAVLRTSRTNVKKNPQK